MNEKEARQSSRELMDVSDAAFLTTIDGGGNPQTRAVFNLRHKTQFPELTRLFSNHADDLVVYFSTNTSSEKIKQIKANPKVAVYYCNPSEFRGLMLGGTIEIITDMDEKEAIWQDGWDRYYSEGVRDPDYMLIRLAPSVARYYHQLDVVEFDPSAKPQ